MKCFGFRQPICLVFCLCVTTASYGDVPAPLIQTVRSVGAKGSGHREAQQALQRLSRMDASALLPILEAFQDANPLAANWLLNAFETISDRELTKRKALPVKDLEAFVVDAKQAPRARRIAFEWLAKVDRSAPDRLIPKMLHDPSSEFRRDAVARLVDAADQLTQKKETGDAASLYRKALTGATDDDQVKRIVKALKQMGQTVDLQTHFGFLVDWRIIGPFDNRDKKGFSVAYPPESAIAPNAVYDGQLGKVKWSSITTEDPYGIIDIAKSISPYKGAVMYLTADFVSDRNQVVEFHLGTPNAWKLWLNGRLLFEREEYHRGMAMDQYRVLVTLREGPNRILLKLCQNEQTEKWAQRYRVQFRVCDSTGMAVRPSRSAR